MLSVLIPTYNYNLFSLVLALHNQLEKTGIVFEIICLDDASKTIFLENEKINSLSKSNYKKLETNIGRSKIRNLLANKATYDWLLFLDADVLPKSNDFISKYIKHINSEEKIVYGGILYSNDKPEKSKLLRWVYGKNREALPHIEREKNEYLSFLTLNFLISKSIFDKVSFNESIPNFRHEDTLFSYNLMQKNITIKHINNPVFHLGIDYFQEALKKEHESLLALKYLIDHQLVNPDYLKISRLFFKIKECKLLFIFVYFHKITHYIFLKNLSSCYPSLLIFDLYRLGYLCSLEYNSKFIKPQNS